MELLDCKKVVAYDWMQFHVNVSSLSVSLLEGYKKYCFTTHENGGVLSILSFNEYLRENNCNEFLLNDIDLKYRPRRLGKTVESKETTLGLNVIVNELEIGSLYCLPCKGSILDTQFRGQYGSFKIHNRMLYTDLDILSNSIDVFMKELKISIVSLTRIDIAIDFPRIKFPLFWELLKEAHYNTKYLKDTSTLVDFDTRKQHLKNRYVLKGHAKVLQINDCNDDFTIRGFKMMTERKIVDGKEKKTSLTKYVKCYHKSREIREKSKKEYILEYWLDNGLITPNCLKKDDHLIQRLEFVARAEELKRFTTIRELCDNIKDGESSDVLIDTLFNVDFINALVQKLCVDFFSFGYVVSTKRKKRDENMLIPNYDTTKDAYIKLSNIELKRREPKREKNEYNIRGTNVMLKQLIKEYYDKNDKTYLLLALQVANNRKCIKTMDDNFYRWSFSLWDCVPKLKHELANKGYEDFKELKKEYYE